ncbi:MAG: serine hydrolase, partial [Vampirovibrionia bacterium]
ANTNFDKIYKNLKYLNSKNSFSESFVYNNILYAVAGYLAGTVYGKSWEELVKDEIFLPLNMTNSSFAKEDFEKSTNKALPYKYENNKITETDYINIGVVGPAGSINSNINDMSKWLLMNINDGKINDKEIIKKQTLMRLHAPQVIIPYFPEYEEESYRAYGLGWGITGYRDHLIVSHEGSIDGFHSHVSFMPKDNIGIVVLSNSATNLPSLIANNAYDRLLGLNQINWNQRGKDKEQETKQLIEKLKQNASNEPKIKSKPSHKLTDYAGKYTHPAYGTLTISIDNNKLKGDYITKFLIEHDKYDVFNAIDPDDKDDEGMKMQFFTDKEGNIYKLSLPLEPDSGKDIYFKKDQNN